MLHSLRGCLPGERREGRRRWPCCIRTDLDCADVCTATGTALSRQTQPSPELLRALVEACRTACRVCGEECRCHGDMHEHCRICGECCQAVRSRRARRCSALAMGATEHRTPTSRSRGPDRRRELYYRGVRNH